MWYLYFPNHDLLPLFFSQSLPLFFWTLALVLLCLFLHIFSLFFLLLFSQLLLYLSFLFFFQFFLKFFSLLLHSFLFFHVLSLLFNCSLLFKCLLHFKCSLLFKCLLHFKWSKLFKLFFFSFLTQEQVKFIFKISFLTRKLGKILDEYITYVNEVFYPRLLLSSYPKWRRNKLFPHACFQLIESINAGFSSLHHSRLPLMPPLTCTSYKSRNNMPKNVRLTIFMKQRLHQFLCIPHPISEWYRSYILPKEWNATMNGMMQLITTMPMQPRTICRICTHDDWVNLRTWIKWWKKRTNTSVPLEVSVTDFLSTKANPCQGYTCKSTQSSHKCSSNKYIESLKRKITNKQAKKDKD